MTSLFAWIDHSERQRRKLLEAIILFREKGTRDELGIGTIRDAFADLLFPGTGSLQTRARYFLFIPWMYRELEGKHVRAADISRRVRPYEVKLIDVLAESSDNDGTIGIQSRSALHRMPSSIYWNGLRTLGIRLFPGTQEEYHRGFDRMQGMSSRTVRNDDGELVDAAGPNWHPSMPKAPVGFPEAASFSVTQEEASYIRERIISSRPASLFAFLMNHLEDWNNADFVWNLPQVDALPGQLAGQVRHARHFSHIMHGAAFLYNLMLAERPPRRDDLAAEYDSALQSWVDEIEDELSELRKWNLTDFWQTVRVADPIRRPHTEAFVNDWIRFTIDDPGPQALIRLPQARALIENRERKLKRALARLDNQRARELWNGAAGTIQIDYRFRNAQWILKDVFAGLRGGSNA